MMLQEFVLYIMKLVSLLQGYGHHDALNKRESWKLEKSEEKILIFSQRFS